MRGTRISLSHSSSPSARLVMKRVREESVPVRWSRRIRQCADVQSGICHFVEFPELLREIGRQLYLPRDLRTFSRLSRTCRAFRDVFGELLALPAWLCRTRDREKSTEKERQRHFKMVRMTFRALYVCDELRLLMKWHNGTSMRSSLWSKFMVDYGGGGY